VLKRTSEGYLNITSIEICLLFASDFLARLYCTWLDLRVTGMRQSIFSGNVLLQTVAQFSLHLRSHLVPLPPPPHNYRIGKEIYGRRSIYALGIVFEVGRDTIRDCCQHCTMVCTLLQEGCGCAQDRLLRARTRPPIPPILAALYNAWIRYQQTTQKVLTATCNNLELLAFALILIRSLRFTTLYRRRVLLQKTYRSSITTSRRLLD
jgi:hypothetical protein